MTGGNFKKRYGGHRHDFKHKYKYVLAHLEAERHESQVLNQIGNKGKGPNL